MVDSLDRPTKPRASPSFDFDERDDPIPLYDQINVAAPGSETPLDNPPAASPKPPLRYSLSEFPKRLPGH